MDKKRILIVGAGEWQVPMITKAQSMGLEVLATDKNPSAPGLKLADVGEVIDTIDINKTLKLAEDSHVDAVATMATDYAVPTVAYIAEKLSLTGISYATAKICSNKSSVRKILQKFNVPSPKFHHVLVVPVDLDKIPLNLPVVVKPVDSCGSKGVRMVNSMDELKEAIEFASSKSMNGCVLIEEFMEGHEVSVEGIVYENEIHILAITDKIVTDSPFFVEIGHTIPSELRQNTQKKIKEVVSNCIDALRINNSAFHIEVKTTSEGPKIVEVGARLGGGAIASHLVPLATGIDLIKENIAMALGNSVQLEPSLNRAAAVRFILPNPGITTSILEFSNLKKIKGVIDINIKLQKGDLVTLLRSSNDRVGYVVTTGNSRIEAVTLAEQIRDNVNVEVS